MRKMIRTLFTWWHSQTPSLRIHSRIRGALVGADQEGNLYYQHKKYPERRWVVYKGLVEASKTPPEWHAWLHHMTASPPQKALTPRRPWQKPHIPNMTGTRAAWRPPGSLHHAASSEISASGDYQPWTPATNPAPQSEKGD